MEFKVKEVSGIVEKSAAQIEEELLNKHEEQLNQDPPANTPPVDTPPIDEPPVDVPTELKEEDVLSYLGKRYNKEINSFDELMAAAQRG